jgi:hypothetical protein
MPPFATVCRVLSRRRQASICHRVQDLEPPLPASIRHHVPPLGVSNWFYDFTGLLQKQPVVIYYWMD